MEVSMRKREKEEASAWVGVGGTKCNGIKIIRIVNISVKLQFGMI